jgi:DNA-binding transcriptional ArsR family regulator
MTATSRLTDRGHTLQSVTVASPPELQPSLWRTCRVLANIKRLHLYGALVREPDQTVSGLAERLGWPVPVASQYLRSLNARGLLRARRPSRWVQYAPVADETIPQASALVAALRQCFLHHPDPIPLIYRLATAFTHPRRGEIYRALRAYPRTTGDLRAHTGIPERTLRRHLLKLQSRGFVANAHGVYHALTPPNAFAAALAGLASP